MLLEIIHAVFLFFQPIVYTLFLSVFLAEASQFLDHYSDRPCICSPEVPLLYLPGHSTNARPNSESETLREGAVDSRRKQSRPRIWTRGVPIGRKSSGTGVGLPLYWDLCQKQDNGGRAVCRNCPSDELFHTAGEAGAVLHSLCGAVKMRCELFCVYLLFSLLLFPVGKNLAHQFLPIGKKVAECSCSLCKNKVHKLRRNVTLERVCVGF